MIDTNRNSVDIVSHGVKLAGLLTNRLWFSGPEFLISDKDSWPSLKVGDKFIIFSEIENRDNDVGMRNVICQEGEGKRGNEEVLEKCRILQVSSIKRINLT